MPDANLSVETLKQAVRQFVAERHWEQFHNPKNLAMSLAIEAAELMEHFQWLDLQAAEQYCTEPARRGAVVEEMADVACYLLALANVLAVDLGEAILAKLEKNRAKYPVEQFQGHYQRPVRPAKNHPLGPTPG